MCYITRASSCNGAPEGPRTGSSPQPAWRDQCQLQKNLFHQNVFVRVLAIEKRDECDKTRQLFGFQEIFTNTELVLLFVVALLCFQIMLQHRKYWVVESGKSFKIFFYVENGKLFNINLHLSYSWLQRTPLILEEWVWNGSEFALNLLLFMPTFLLLVAYNFIGVSTSGVHRNMVC